MADWLIYSYLPHDESVLKHTWHTRSRGNLHRKTLSGLCYYAAVLLRGGRVCRPLVLVTPHSQSTGRTLCIVLYTHFRSINVLSFSLSTWSCIFILGHAMTNYKYFLADFQFQAHMDIKCPLPGSLFPNPTSQDTSSTITQALYAAPNVKETTQTAEKHSRSLFRCWIHRHLVLFLHNTFCLCSFWQSAHRKIIR